MGKFCRSCGAELDENARFCENCGAKIPARKSRAVQNKTPPAAQKGGQNVTPPIAQAGEPQGFLSGAGGKYYWYYEMNMFKDPTVFFTCFKAFTLVVGIMSLIMFFIMLGDGFIEAALFFLKFFVFGMGGMTALLAIGYGVYALIMGGKYCVVFEMDEKGVTHTQLASQFKRAQVIAGLAALAGAASGSLSTMGAGLLAGSRNSMKTNFKSVSSIKVNRRRKVIYLVSGLGSNQIYAQSDMFDNVLEHILARIPQSAKRKGV